MPAGTNWMTAAITAAPHLPHVTAAVGAASCGLALRGRAAHRGAAARVLSKVRVSGSVSLGPGCTDANGNGAHLAVDPTGPRYLAVVYSLGEGTGGVVATSHDGGASWGRGHAHRTHALHGEHRPDDTFHRAAT